jgi:putative FmdB family regulatory protein
MPTYTYKCTNKSCSKHEECFEVIQKITDDKLETCSECDTNSLTKVIVPSVAGFNLQGKGWTRKIGSGK